MLVGCCALGRDRCVLSLSADGDDLLDDGDDPVLAPLSAVDRHGVFENGL